MYSEHKQEYSPSQQLIRETERTNDILLDNCNVVLFTNMRTSLRFICIKNKATPFFLSLKNGEINILRPRVLYVSLTI